MNNYIEIEYVEFNGENTLIKTSTPTGYLLGKIYLNINHIVSIDAGCSYKMCKLPKGLWSEEYEYKNVFGFTIIDVNDRKYYIPAKHFDIIKKKIFNCSNTDKLD